MSCFGASGPRFVEFSILNFIKSADKGPKAASLGAELKELLAE